MAENHVEGYAGWSAFVEKNKGKEIFALFCGGKDESGKSWCPDCVTAEPVSSTLTNKLTLIRRKNHNLKLS